MPKAAVSSLCQWRRRKAFQKKRRAVSRPAGRRCSAPARRGRRQRPRSGHRPRPLIVREAMDALLLLGSPPGVQAKKNNFPAPRRENSGWLEKKPSLCLWPDTQPHHFHSETNRTSHHFLNPHPSVHTSTCASVCTNVEWRGFNRGGVLHRVNEFGTVLTRNGQRVRF